VPGPDSRSQHSAAHFKEASVLFLEISDFAALSATLPASELVAGAYTRPRFGGST
jgi:hypothetical protein